MAKKFIIASTIFLVIGTIEGLLIPTKGVFKDFYAGIFFLPPEQVRPFFSDFLSRIHSHVSLAGWLSLAMMGVVYQVLPQMSPGARISARAVSLNFGYIRIPQRDIAII